LAPTTLSATGCSRFDRHHGQDQHGSTAIDRRRGKRRDEARHRLLGDAVAPGDELGHETLLALARRLCRHLDRARSDARGLKASPPKLGTGLDEGIALQRQE